MESAAGVRDIGAVANFPRGEFHPASVPGKDIWVLRTPDDRWYAIKNTCPHQGAPLCFGSVTGTFLPSDPDVYEFGMEYRMITCPYHGYEYDLDTGEPAFVTGVRERVVRYDVTVKDDRVFLYEKGK
jgi:nitrite reductase/ring-hydroxylating ferredoxin subunit